MKKGQKFMRWTDGRICWGGNTYVGPGDVKFAIRNAPIPVTGIITKADATALWSFERWPVVLVVGIVGWGKTLLAQGLQSAHPDAPHVSPRIIDDLGRRSIEPDELAAIDRANPNEPVIVVIQALPDVPLPMHQHINDGKVLVLCGRVSSAAIDPVAEKFGYDRVDLDVLKPYEFMVPVVKLQLKDRPMQRFNS